MDEERKIILHKEIDLIQTIIERLATKSFLLKGWYLSMFTLAFSFNFKNIIGQTNFGNILFFPAVSFLFWYLDSFFLHKEKRYRKLYDWVIKNRMKSNEYFYDLDHNRFKNDTESIFQTMFSNTLILYYGIPMSIFIATLIRI